MVFSDVTQYIAPVSRVAIQKLAPKYSLLFYLAGMCSNICFWLGNTVTRFIYAGCEHDFTSMLVAFEEMGVKLNRFNPAEDMRSIRFLLRDTQSAAESKEDTARFRKRMAKRRGRELKNPVDAYPGGWWCDLLLRRTYFCLFLEADCCGRYI